MLSVIDREVSFVTWLRYTAWIPLYPTGFVLEGNFFLFLLPWLACDKIVPMPVVIQ